MNACRCCLTSPSSVIRAPMPSPSRRRQKLRRVRSPRRRRNLRRTRRASPRSLQTRPRKAPRRSLQKNTRRRPKRTKRLLHRRSRRSPSERGRIVTPQPRGSSALTVGGRRVRRWQISPTFLFTPRRPPPRFVTTLSMRTSIWCRPIRIPLLMSTSTTTMSCGQPPRLSLIHI